jgi:hypothetical protein
MATLALRHSEVVAYSRAGQAHVPFWCEDYHLWHTAFGKRMGFCGVPRPGLSVIQVKVRPLIQAG